MRTSHPLFAAAALAAALALPVAAQQSAAAPADNAPQSQSTQPADNGAANAAATSSATPEQTAQQNAEQANADRADQASRQPLRPQTHEGFWGHLNPFARKKYVQTQLQPVRSRLNELDELTADNAHSISTLDSESRAGISAAQNRADQANQQAQAATQQAQQTAAQAQQLDQQVATVRTNLQGADQYKVAQTTVVNFRPGSATLNATARQSLDQFLAGLANRKGYIVEVRAYSAGRGARAMENSQRLADAVVRYLVLQNNIPLYRIYTSGLGNAPAPATAASAAAPARLTRGGRVDISILNNDLAANEAAAANPAGQSQ